MRELERRVLLSVLDRKWREHLYEMDYLREGIGLRAYSQRDPLVEYQREGFDMFAAMMDGIKEESVGFLFNLEVQVERGRRSRSRSPPRIEIEPGQRVRAPAAASGRSAPVRRAPRSRRRPQPPHDPGQGPRAPEAAAEPVLLRARRGRRGRGARPARPTDADDPFAGVGRNASAPAARARSTRSATAARRPHRPDHPRRRLIRRREGGCVRGVVCREGSCVPRRVRREGG